MKKNELFLFTTPLLVIAALGLMMAGTKYARKIRRSQETIVVRAGTFRKEASSRVLLQKLSSALKAHPDNNKFELLWHVNTDLSNGGNEVEMFTLTYNRRNKILEQSGPGGFRYKGVTDEAIHTIAKNDKTVVRLTPKNLTRVHIFTTKQRLAYHIEILPTDTNTGEGTTIVVKERP